MTLPGTDQVLRHGYKGEAVMNLQRDLKALGFDPGAIDGRFGTITESAVRAFQLAVGVAVDGVAGPETRQAIAQAMVRHAAEEPAPQPETWPQQNSPAVTLPKPSPVPAPRSGGVNGIAAAVGIALLLALAAVFYFSGGFNG